MINSIEDMREIYHKDLKDLTLVPPGLLAQSAVSALQAPLSTARSGICSQ